jgi:uncharacterized protein (TIGR00369 family)
VSGASGTTRRELIEAFVPHSPHAAALGITLVEVGTDEAVLEMPFKPDLATLGDVVHGGAIGTLIDTAAMTAAWASDELTDSPAGATVALSVNFVAAARGCDLRAAARVTKRGRELSFCEIEVSDADGKPIATGIATYRFG